MRYFLTYAILGLYLGLVLALAGSVGPPNACLGDRPNEAEAWDATAGASAGPLDCESGQPTYMTGDFR